MKSPTEPCRLCGAEARWVRTATLRFRHDVGYYLCPRCDLLQTEAPTWLEEAYASPICATDTGMVKRNRALARKAAAVLVAFGPAEPRGVDYGSATGLFVRMMRDLGFDYRGYDRYAQNVFAQGFDWSPESGRADFVSCFECIEHFADSAAEFAKVFAVAPRTLATTTLRDVGSVPGDDWHYWGYEHGQHIAFHSTRSLDFAAAQAGLRRTSVGDLHYFAASPPSARALAWSLKGRFLVSVLAAWRYRGRAGEDAETLRAALERAAASARHD